MKFFVVISTLLLALSSFGARYSLLDDKQSLSAPQLGYLFKSKDRELHFHLADVGLKYELMSTPSRVVETPKAKPKNADPSNPWGIGAINAKKAWPLSKKGQGIRILVLDSGADVQHPALIGQVEAVKNFVDKEDTVFDEDGHGTHIAGVIAGKELENGFSGVAPGAKLLIGKICKPDGCTSRNMIAGIEWGIEQKVDIINLSIGDSVLIEAERKVIAKAEEAGIVVVSATGNAGVQGVCYPAAFETPIAVGGVSKGLKLSKRSNWGPEIDIVAPGDGIVSSVPTGSGRSYARYSGTSMAAPFVSGVVALIKASHPSLTPAQIRKLIEKTATPLGSRTQFGMGFINAEKAVKEATQVKLAKASR